MRTFSKVLALVIGAAFSGSMVSAETVKIYKPSKSFVQLSKEKLGKDGKKRLAHFKSKAGYYGAVAINISEDLGGSTWDYHSLEQAKKHALKSCKAKSKSPSNCQLYALSVPKGFPQGASGFGLSGFATKILTRGELKKALKDDRYGAIAVSGMWSWGWSTSNASIEDARADALKWCQKGSNESKDTADNFWVTKVATSRDWKCSVRLSIDGEQ